MKSIFTSLSPNTQADDIILSVARIFLPWSYVRGPAPRILEQDFSRRLGVRHAFSFDSGRTSLLSILTCMNLAKGDEVLVQALTCVAVPDPILWAGLVPVYVDCDEKTFTMSSEDFKRKITPKSKAVVIQHTFGQPAKMDELIAIARKNNLLIIEDCAHALGATHNNRKVGTFGDASFFSFGRDKVISSVFGGVVATDNDTLAERLEDFQKRSLYPSRLWVFRQLMHPIVLYKAKLTYDLFKLGRIILEAAKQMRIVSLAVEAEEKMGRRPSFVGHKLPNALAILALHQLKKLNGFNEHRKKIAGVYDAELSKMDNITPARERGSSHIFLRYSILSDKKSNVMNAAKRERIYLGDWYSQPVAPKGVDYERVRYRMGSCPNAEETAEKIINLPTDIHISESDAKRVVRLIQKHL